VSVIGLFGLAGLVGAVAAQRAGRIHDRGWSLPATGAGWALALIAFGIAALGGHSVVLLLIAIVVLDVAIQGVNILNQTRMFEVSHDARSRLNTAYVTNNFVGGAIGSAAATVLWSVGGWTAVTIAGAALSCFALGCGSWDAEGLSSWRSRPPPRLRSHFRTGNGGDDTASAWDVVGQDLLSATRQRPSTPGLHSFSSSSPRFGSVILAELT
jgi:MFS family permease